MIYKDEIPSDNFEQLHAENEKIKKLLVEDYGACFPDLLEEVDFPPELENQFLNHVLKYESEFNSAKIVSVYDYLGEPDFLLADNLSDKEIAEELDWLTGLLNLNMISLDTICDVPKRELYRFITEELFFEEIDDMQMPGMTTHFIYEEFHPNHEYDIQHHSEGFFTSYLNLEDDYYLHLLTNEAKQSDWHIHFRKAFTDFKLNDFSIVELKRESESATVQFSCDFSGSIDGCHESLRYVGEGEICLVYEHLYWCVDTIKLPASKVSDVRILC